MQYLFFSAVLAMSLSTYAQVGIGTTTPNASSQLELNSTTKGFLPPRMSFAQRNAIVSPAPGLIVYCADCGTNYGGEPQYYNGVSWVNMIGGVASLPPPSILICGQEWSMTNLNVSIYRNGDPIPNVTDNTAWDALTTGAWCWYNNDSVNYAATYGKLYNWYAVNDPRGLSPIGWHIPTDVDWVNLTTCQGGELVAGGPMKEAGTSHWLSPNTGATNSSGFTGLPAGGRSVNGSFSSWVVFDRGMWWSSTQADISDAWCILMYSFLARADRAAYSKTFGFSVRCIKD